VARAKSKSASTEPPSLDVALWEASGKKDALRVRLLLEAGADPSHEPRRFAPTPLQRAIEVGADEVIEALLEGGASRWGMMRHAARSARVTRACIEAGARELDRALAMAAVLGETDVVHALLDAGADVNGSETSDGTPLVNACRGGHVETARTLLARGADRSRRGSVPITRPGVTTHERLTPLEAAARSSAELVALLLEDHVDPDELASAMTWAAVEGRLDALELLLRAGATPSALRSATLAAAREGQVELVRALLDRVPLDGPEGSLLLSAMRGAVKNPSDAARRALVDALFARDPLLTADEDGTTLLHLAAFLGTHVARLIDARCSVHARDPRGLTPLRYVRSYADPTVLDPLIAAGADVDVRGEDGLTLLAEVSLHAALEHVEKLLAAGADPNARGPNGESALHRACFVSQYPRPGEHERRARVVELLLAAGADPTAIDARGDTPLGIAARAGASALVAKLEAALPSLTANDPQERARATLARFGIAFDAQGLLAVARSGQLSDALRAFAEAGFDFASDAGYDALIAAIEREALPVVRFLVEHGAPLRSHRPSPLCRAADTRSEPLVSLLLSLGADPNALGVLGDPPLCDAVRALAPSIVEVLLRHGANPSLGRTPPLFQLTTAIREAQEDGRFAAHAVSEIVARLVEAGADLEQRCAGSTPLVRAVRWEQPILVRALVRAGADVDARDDDGRSARELAAGPMREALSS
jgi:ankyrin repeat protein